VFGVDCTDIAYKATDIVAANGLSDKITIIKGLVEEVELPVRKVDIIISEWMGYFLLYESMLDSVLYARDKWLRSDGLMFPDKATLYIAGIEDSEYRENKIDFWDNIYGIKMPSIKQMALKDPLVDLVYPEAIVTSPCPIFHCDI
jgi:protein arginine N-methyltransferase 1